MTMVDRVMARCIDDGIRVFGLAASADGAGMYAALGFVPYANEMILRLKAGR